MFQLFRTISLRYIIQKWDRAGLIVASIALGVATLVSTEMINNCLSSIAENSTNPVELGDLHIVNGELGIPEQVVTDLKKAKVPGLNSFLPLVYERVVLSEMQDTPAFILGTDFSFMTDFKPTDSNEGSSAPQDILKTIGLEIELVEKNRLAILLGNGVFVSRDLYNERIQAGFDVSKPMKIRVSTMVTSLYISGILTFSPDSKASVFAKSLIAMPFSAAARVLKAPPSPGITLLSSGLISGYYETLPTRVNRIDLFLDPGYDPEILVPEIQKIVGSRAKVRTREQLRKATEDVIGGVQISFSLCAVGAIVVGLFLVYNAISVSVTERRHDIGILRSLGSTKFQIGALFTNEALFLGLIGGILGIPFGLALAKFAMFQIQDELESLLAGTDLLNTRLSLDTSIKALIGGIGTALIASLFPAIQAASDEPADAVRRAPSSIARLLQLIHLISCISLIGVGLLVILLRDSLPSRMGSYLGLIITLIGLFLSLPLIVSWLAKLIQPLLRPFFGVEARLASDNLIRAPGRTGIVIGALAGGVSLMFQTAGVGRSNEEPVVAWIDQVLQADAVVLWGNLLTASSSSSPILPYIADEIQNEVPGIEAVVRFRMYRPEYENTVIYVQSIDAIAYQKEILKRISDPPPGIKDFHKLPKGNFTIVSENFAVRYHKKIGDTIFINGPKGNVPLEIVGIGRDYSWNKGTIFLDHMKYLELFEDEYSDFFHVFFKEGVNKEETMKLLEKKMELHQLIVKDRKFVRGFLMSEIEKIYKLAYTQQFLVGVVAALGVVMALLISVLQRRRELGLLRAVGATQGQVLRSVLAEAMLMGILGTFLGIAMGIPLEWYLLRVILFEESGFYFEVLIPWIQTLGIAIIAISVATLAGLLPAIHAVRLKITDAIAYE